MDKRINCDSCPLNGIGTDELCESNCSNMADFIDEIRTDVIDEVIDLYNEMRGSLATNVYEFGERLKQLKEQMNESVDSDR